MSDLEIGMIILMAASVGGAIGAKISGQQGWKGLLIVVCAAAALDLSLRLASSQNPLIGIPAAIIIGSAIGGVLRMTVKQITIILLGAFLIQIPVAMVAL